MKAHWPAPAKNALGVIALAAIICAVSTAIPIPPPRPHRTPYPASTTSNPGISTTTAANTPRIRIANLETWRGANGTLCWIDARPASRHDAGHVPGAIRITDGEWENGFAALSARWSPDLHIIVYCDGGSCHADQDIAQRLIEAFADAMPPGRIATLDGGWPAWQAWNQLQRPATAAHPPSP